MEIVIRDYRPADLARLKAITVLAFDGVSIAQNIHHMLGPVGGHDWTWHKERAIEQDAAHGGSKIFVAEVDSKIIGFITTRIDAVAGIGMIPNIAVANEYQGQRIGRRLLLHALEFFRSRAIRTAHIETLEQNEVGQHLYPDVGFREVARQIHFAMDL